MVNVGPINMLVANTIADVIGFVATNYLAGTYVATEAVYLGPLSIRLEFGKLHTQQNALLGTTGAYAKGFSLNMNVNPGSIKTLDVTEMGKSIEANPGSVVQLDKVEVSLWDNKTNQQIDMLDDWCVLVEVEE